MAVVGDVPAGAVTQIRRGVAEVRVHARAIGQVGGGIPVPRASVSASPWTKTASLAVGRGKAAASSSVTRSISGRQPALPS